MHALHPGTTTKSSTKAQACVTLPLAVRQLEVNEISPAREPVRIGTERRDAATVTAFIEAAFDEHEARVHGMVLALTRDPEVAADMTQEAFLRLVTEAHAGRYPDNPGGWLYRTASNLAVSRARRVAVARRLAPRLLRRDEPPSPEGIALERERSQVMRDALARLPLAQRTALIMAAQGVTGEEIAAHLDKSHGATRNMMLRARRQLRRTVEELEARR